ncbi:MAG: aquaporin [Acidimicrobiaceae bacterium]|nr:aquaporin [Candidatus Dormibacteraeota bacterium]MBO0747962.1 aquaporin [Acidimicrobiaceae bacterium]
MAATDTAARRGSNDSRALSLTGAVLGEMLGTFIFVFSGTATALGIDKLHPSPTFTPEADIAVSLAFAFGVVAAVYVFAEVSGAHINPAVTIALLITGEFPPLMAVPYIAAQFVGGILAALANWLIFGNTLRQALLLGSTHPGVGVGWGQALFTEFVITAILMMVVMATAIYKRSPGGGVTAGLGIGLWVGAAIFLALPVSGGSLNPARTIGPDIVSGQFPYWWVYLVGPIVGACFGAALWKFIVGKGVKEVVDLGLFGHRSPHRTGGDG